MLQIRKQVKAERDLIDIWRYGAGEWGFHQADAYLDDIETALRFLAEHPGAGVDYSHFRPGIRKWSVNEHMIFYSTSDTALHVVRVLSGRQDAAAHLNE